MRNTAWQRLLDISRFVRYYNRLASKFQTQSDISRFVLVLSGVGLFGSVINVFPDFLIEILVPLFGLLVGAIALLDLIYRPGEKAANLHIVSREVNRLEEKCRSLWEKIDVGQIETTNYRKN